MALCAYIWKRMWIFSQRISALFTGVENLQMSQAQLHQGKKIFQAKVTESFPHGYTIETIIDGKPLRGILFANKPITTQMVNNNNTRWEIGHYYFLCSTVMD